MREIKLSKNRATPMKPVALSVFALCVGLAQVNAQAQVKPEGLAEQKSVLEVITVTSNKESTTLRETPASVGVINEADIRLTGPTHPQQLLSQVPGVAVGVNNGEGHNMAIRQPFSTNPLYLYLEDGIATRATGFFNHTTHCMKSIFHKPVRWKSFVAQGRPCMAPMPLQAL